MTTPQKIAEIKGVLERIDSGDYSDVAKSYEKSEEWLQSLLEALRQRELLIEGLRWYADTKNYEYRTSYLDQDAPIIDDSGQRARDILKEIGEQSES